MVVVAVFISTLVDVVVVVGVVIVVAVDVVVTVAPTAGTVDVTVVVPNDVPPTDVAITVEVWVLNRSQLAGIERPHDIWFVS